MIHVRWSSVAVAVLALLASSARSSAAQSAAPTPAADSAFKPTGRVWGLIFADYFYKLRGDSAWGGSQYARVPRDLHAGQLRRLYLGYDYQISPDFSSRVLLESNNTSTFANGSYGVFVKLGYLSWRRPIGLPVTVTTGLLPTPIFTFPEAAWGYRSIEKEALDARGIGSSADQGVSIEGALGSDGQFRVMLGNNSGTQPARRRSKAVYTSVAHSFLDKRLSVELMGTYLPAGPDRSRSVGRTYLGWTSKRIRLGGELAIVDEEAPIEFAQAAGTNVRRLLASGFVALPFTVGDLPLNVFGRFDLYDPDIRFAASRGYVTPDAFYTERLVTIGLDVKLAKDVHIMPNLWINDYRSRGGAITRAADVVPRVTMYWRF